MKNILLFILVLMTLTQNVKSQEKVMEGDTAFWYRNKKLTEKLKLKDLSTTHDDFSFRYWNYGQVVEIIKNNDSITGLLTNFIYTLNIRNLNPKDTIYNKKAIDSDRVNAVYKIIQNSKILELQSDNMIVNWVQGADGHTDVIEHSDKNTYWFKKYWTPSFQNAVPESITVSDFVKSFSDTLNLDEKFKEFETNLPRNGCYRSGSMLVTCNVSNFFELGYYGSTKLPIGYSASLNLGYIGRFPTNLGFRICHQFDQHSNYDFELTVVKLNLIFNKSHKENDFFYYQYRKRELDFLHSGTTFDNHQFYYGLKLKKNFDIALGVDYLLGENKTVGGILYVSKWISRPGISIYGKTSIFENHVDYQLGISKSFFFYNRLLSINAFYEGFKGYNDLNLSLTISI